MDRLMEGYGREEYGEADRPMPSNLLTEVREKFVEWDAYKQTVIKNTFDQKRKEGYMQIH